MNGVEGMREFGRLQVDLQQRLPRYVFRAIAAGMYQEGKSFLKQWRGELDGKFNTGGRKVANSFKVYTAGRSLGELELVIFTRWAAAPIYEHGGVIRGNWLMFAITPRAYTPSGRVRRDYRDPTDPSRWNPAKLEGLFPLPTKRPGVIILAREVTGTASGRGRGYRTRQRTSTGSEIENRSRVAVEPAFMLVRKTRREPVLDFFSGFERYSGAGAGRLQQTIRRAVGAFARDTRSGADS